jgi:prophage antirepressor-like protein
MSFARPRRASIAPLPTAALSSRKASGHGTTLGYKDATNAVKQHCRRVAKHRIPHSQNLQKTIVKNFIPEGDLYRLIIRSKLPAAIRFEAWVCDGILPGIRKHGACAADGTLDEMFGSPEFAKALIRKLAEEHKKNAAFEELAEEMAPKALYCDIILQSKNLMPVSLIAMEYGMSASSFNSLLHDLGIQFRIAETWRLYQEYAGNGYTLIRTCRTGEKAYAIHTCWTQGGHMFSNKKLKVRDILPLIEKRAHMN